MTTPVPEHIGGVDPELHWALRRDAWRKATDPTARVLDERYPAISDLDHEHDALAERLDRERGRPWPRR